MCSINHELKAIFIHTPKCGGMFIERILENLYGFETYYFTHENHNDFLFNPEKINTDTTLSLKGFLRISKYGVLHYFKSSNIHNEKMKMTKEKWETYTKFAVIRNPYDRFISSYKYVLSKKYTNLNLNEFIKNSHNHLDVVYFHSFINQYDHLIDEHNKLSINHYIRFENLNSDLCEVLLKIGVKILKHRNILLKHIKINNTSQIENYCEYYKNNEELILFINNHFQKDFIYFNFIKCNSYDEMQLDSKKYFITNEEFERNNIQLLIDLDEKNSIVQDTTQNNASILLNDNIPLALNETTNMVSTQKRVISDAQHLKVIMKILRDKFGADKKNSFDNKMCG
jgi:hypothetical protein